VANDDTYILGANGQLTVPGNGVLANDFDPMGKIVGAQLAEGVAAGIGTLNFNPDGSFTFAAGPNFQGQATFTYQDVVQIGNIMVPGATATVRIITSALIASTTNLVSVSFNTNATITSDAGAVTPGPQFQYGIPGDGVISGHVNGPISFTMGTTWLPCREKGMTVARQKSSATRAKILFVVVADHAPVPSQSSRLALFLSFSTSRRTVRSLIFRLRAISSWVRSRPSRLSM
jgi:hypothetical protein